MKNKQMTLHGYWRSSASYRVRIALALKGIKVFHKTVNLKSGEHLEPTHRDLNEQALVPILALHDGTKLTQSLVIIDYLEAMYPTPALLPTDIVKRSKIKSAANIIASDIAPIQNLRVLKYIKEVYGQNQNSVESWAAHWIIEGFQSLERLLSTNEKPFLYSDYPGYFECCLVPQVYNANRFGVDMGAYPKLNRINNLCQEMKAFKFSKPENQADAH